MLTAVHLSIGKARVGHWDFTYRSGMQNSKVQKSVTVRMLLTGEKKKRKRKHSEQN